MDVQRTVVGNEMKFGAVTLGPGLFVPTHIVPTDEKDISFLKDKAVQALMLEFTNAFPTFGCWAQQFWSTHAQSIQMYNCFSSWSVALATC